MKQIYDEIVQLLEGDLGQRLGMDANKISYSVEDDPGEPAPGYTTRGRWENIDIPDEYMTKAGSNSAEDFLEWLKKA